MSRLAPFSPSRDAKDVRLLSQRLQGTSRGLRLAYPLLHALIPSGPHSLPGPGSAIHRRPVKHKQTHHWQSAVCLSTGRTQPARAYMQATDDKQQFMTERPLLVKMHSFQTEHTRAR
jgi:hypothetical protein